MINLTPPEAKKIMKREYWIRVMTVWMLLISMVAVVTIALLVPTYVLLARHLEAKAIEIQHTDSAFDMDAYESMKENFKDAQTVAERLAIERKGAYAAQILADIEAVQTDDISLASFTYEYDGAAVTKVSINGIATTREALASFAESLEQNPLFTSADVPVSSLTRDRDLPFTLAITLAKKEPKP